VSKKKPTPPTKIDPYAALLTDVKARIRHAQTRAVLAVNAELVRLHWDIGRALDAKQAEEGWGTGVIPRLALDLKNELPELKGFSERNIDRMIRFFRAYPTPEPISPQPVAKLESSPVLQQPAAKVPQPVAEMAESLIWSVPWAHHVILLEKVKPFEQRTWYMRETLAHGWSRNILSLQIAGDAHARRGKAVTNFAATLPAPESDLAQQSLKDPYIFDFLTLTEPFQERELETGLVGHLETFLLELGAGFAFVGRQYRLDVAGLTLTRTRALPPSLQSALPTVEEIEAELAETEPPAKPAKPPHKKSGGRK